MAHTIEYKGYIGSIDPDTDEGVLYGKVVNIDGGLMYEGATIAELRSNMQAVVDDYLALCKQRGIEPHTPFSGNVSLRMPNDLHARIAATAESKGVSMNQLIVDALRSAIDQEGAA